MTREPRCDAASNSHFHGEGDFCECGEQPNVLATFGDGEPVDVFDEPDQVAADPPRTEL